MNIPLIVGVRHGTHTNKLLNRECRAEFRKLVFPSIDRTTLLLLEGAYQKEYVEHTGSFSSFFQRWKVARYIGAPIGHSTIGWCDGRYLTQLAREVQAENLAFIAYAEEKIRPRIILPENTPTNFAALAQAVRSTQLAYDITEKNDRGQRGMYMGIVCTWSLFDYTMIKAAREWGASGRHTIILCGTIHAFTIHRSTGWPITFLSEDSPTNAYEETLGLISCALYPESVLGKMPLVLR